MKPASKKVGRVAHWSIVGPLYAVAKEAPGDAAPRPKRAMKARPPATSIVSLRHAMKPSGRITKIACASSSALPAGRRVDVRRVARHEHPATR